MARFKDRLPTAKEPALSSDGSFSYKHRRFLIEVEKVTRSQLSTQAPLDSGATLSETITAFNTLIANMKNIGLMEK